YDASSSRSASSPSPRTKHLAPPPRSRPGTGLLVGRGGHRCVRSAYWIGNIAHDNPGVAPLLFTYHLAFVRVAAAELSPIVSSPILLVPVFLAALFPSGPTRPLAAYLWMYALSFFMPFIVFSSLRPSPRLAFLWHDDDWNYCDLALFLVATLCNFGFTTVMLFFFTTPTPRAASIFAVCFMTATLVSLVLAYGATSARARAMYRLFDGQVRG
ncbi:hypothetical protein DFH09DRAFT_1153869, partial [Mycena vulgaris]